MQRWRGRERLAHTHTARGQFTVVTDRSERDPGTCTRQLIQALTPQGPQASRQASKRVASRRVASGCGWPAGTLTHTHRHQPACRQWTGTNASCEAELTQHTTLLTHTHGHNHTHTAQRDSRAANGLMPNALMEMISIDWGRETGSTCNGIALPDLCRLFQDGPKEERPRWQGTGDGATIDHTHSHARDSHGDHRASQQRAWDTPRGACSSRSRDPSVQPEASLPARIYQCCVREITDQITASAGPALMWLALNTESLDLCSAKSGLEDTILEGDG